MNVSPSPAPARGMNLPEELDRTPTGRPQWYGDALGREQRSWLSKTGDVFLFAGNTFPTSFTRVKDAFVHARRASDGELGAVFVMRARDGADATEGKHRHRYWLTRSYNAEMQRGELVVDQSQIDGRERVTDFDHHVVALVDGRVTLRNPDKHH